MTSLFSKEHQQEIESLSRPSNPDAMFVAGGIKAAQHSDPHIQQLILDDVADILGCSSEELRFMIDKQSLADDVSVFDFPDDRRRRDAMFNHQKAKNR